MNEFKIEFIKAVEVKFIKRVEECGNKLLAQMGQPNVTLPNVRTTRYCIPKIYITGIDFSYKCSCDYNHDLVHK